MNLKNWLTLTIRPLDFNLVAQQPKLLEKLRELTIVPWSGLNYEMDRMLQDIQEGRSVNCQVILAYRFGKLIAWALFSKEDSDFPFHNTDKGFKAEDGYLFQVFVDHVYRKQGIATELFLAAKKMAGDEILCVCPHDEKSETFYAKYPSEKMKVL